MKQNFQIRAVQIDLARQMETIPFLKRYIDFIAEHPEHLLSPDVNFTDLGNQNSIGSFHNRAIAETVNSITVNMKKAK